MKNNLIETFGDILDLRDKPFVMVDKKIIEDIETFNKNELLAYVVICKYADNSSRQAYPSLSQIAKFMRTSKDTTRLAIKGLIEKGVLVYQQRLNPENPNENVSNLYAIVDNKNWSKAKLKNTEVIKEREEKYRKRVLKSNKTKINNKKVASTTNTNNFNESNNDSKNSINTNIVSHDTENIQEKNVNVNIQLLKNSNIKYINYKKNNDKIIAMDTAKLEKAIALTIEKADKPNWNYLITTYDSISENNSVKSNNIKNTKTKFHNFESNLDNITEEEFNKKYNEAVKIKNGEVQKVKNKFTEDTDPAKRLYLEAVSNNWDNIGAGTYNIAKQYAIKYNKSYK